MSRRSLTRICCALVPAGMLLVGSGHAAIETQAPRQAVTGDQVAVIWGGGAVPPSLMRRYAMAVWIDLDTLALPAERLERLLISPGVAHQPVAAATVAALEKSPGLIGVWVPRHTALVAVGRRLEVVGGGTVTICLPASSSRPRERPLLVRHLAAGDRADLVALSRAAVARRGPRFPPEETRVPEVPCGTLLACGGGEIPAAVWRRFIDLAGGVEAPIVVVPIATPNPDNPRPKGVEELQRLGCRHVTILRQRSREEVESPEFAEALQHARGVWLVGGRQWKYIDAYEGTVAERLLQGVLQRGGVIGGTSAGAAIQAEYLVRGDPLGNKNIVAEGYERGLGLLPGTAIDIHVAERGRLTEMSQLIRAFPQLLGISLDERTAIEVRGHAMRVLGNGRVRIVEAHAASPLILQPGENFDLAERRKGN